MSRHLTSTFTRTISAAVLATGLVAAALPAATAQASTAVTCTDSLTPVSLTGSGPQIYRIWGELCRPAGSTPSLVQVLLPGATYNHYYWDLPYENGKYSYVRYMNQAGYTTFAIDRIGTGKSSHPLSALVTNDSNAVTVHELIQKLKAGQIDGIKFSKVVTVGHSLGTLIGMIEAATYHDVDGFIATGILHSLNTLFVPDLTPLLYPAFLDPKFKGLDPGYLTTNPANRGVPIFYNPGHFDPGVLAADEKYARDTVTDLELSLFPVTIADGTTTKITAPTLVAIGQDDEIFCGGIGGTDCSTAATVLANEKPFYPNAPLSTYVLAGSGHDINFHYGAQNWFAAAAKWVQSTFPGA